MSAVSSADCGVVCVAVTELNALRGRTRPHEHRELSQIVGDAITDAVRSVGQCFVWVDCGDPGREVILYERAADAVSVAQAISETWKDRTLSFGGEALGLQVAAHWGTVTWDNSTLKISGAGIRDAVTYQMNATSGAANVSPACEQAAAERRVCLELSRRPSIFISYNHEDNKRPRFVDELLQQLKPFERTGELSVFVDTKIRPGDLWFRAIMLALACNRGAVLLTSPRFFASDFIMDHELPSIEQAHKERKLEVFWVSLAEAAYLSRTWLATVQAAHDPKRPIGTLGTFERNMVWAQLVRTIAERVKEARRAH